MHTFTRFFFTTGFFLLFLLFVVPQGVLAATCFTRAQVSSDNRCLYIMSNKVYEKGTRTEPHQDHPCGTDVSSIVPASHLTNIPTYLTPNYRGDICTAPTPTKIPTPTKAPTPTPVPPSPTPRPTATPVPTATIAPTRVVLPTTTVIPTITLRPTSGPSIVIPSQATVTPTPSPSPTVLPPAGLPVLAQIDAATADELSSYDQLFRLSYQSLVNCYGSRLTSATCTDKASGDINGDGKIDEIDYNLILIGFSKIDRKKFLLPTPSPIPTVEPTAEPTIVPTAEPTLVPTAEPTALPTNIPEATVAPTNEPEPTSVPIVVAPTKSPLLVKGIALSQTGAYGSIVSIPSAVVAIVIGSLRKRKKKATRPK